MTQDECETGIEESATMPPKRVEVISQQELFKKYFFSVKEVKLKYEQFSGAMSAELTRLNFERGDSVAILMHDPEADTVVLTEQFRFPAYKPGNEKETGWILEIPAGTVEKGESAEDTVRREVKEEIGYDVREVKHLTTFYVSPGWTSERIMLYYASVNPKDQTSQGGGIVSEGEDIRVMLVKVNDALHKINTGELKDAKSIIALQWLQLHRAIGK
jgi:nudix-type nucleoside diphosphatase (YffH/AdpP family)